MKQFLLFVLMPVWMPAQMTDATPELEVATIKPSEEGQPGFAVTLNGGRFRARSAKVKDLLTLAFGVHPKQVTGLPGWAEREGYDIEAPLVAVPNGAQLRHGGEADRGAIRVEIPPREARVIGVRDLARNRRKGGTSR